MWKPLSATDLAFSDEIQTLGAVVSFKTSQSFPITHRT